MKFGFLFIIMMEEPMKTRLVKIQFLFITNLLLSFCFLAIVSFSLTFTTSAPFQFWLSKTLLAYLIIFASVMILSIICSTFLLRRFVFFKRIQLLFFWVFNFSLLNMCFIGLARLVYFSFVL